MHNKRGSLNRSCRSTHVLDSLGHWDTTISENPARTTPVGLEAIREASEHWYFSLRIGVGITITHGPALDLGDSEGNEKFFAQPRNNKSFKF